MYGMGSYISHQSPFINLSPPWKGERGEGLRPVMKGLGKGRCDAIAAWNDGIMAWNDDIVTWYDHFMVQYHDFYTQRRFTLIFFAKPSHRVCLGTWRGHGGPHMARCMRQEDATSQNQHSKVASSRRSCSGWFPTPAHLHCVTGYRVIEIAASSRCRVSRPHGSVNFVMLLASLWTGLNNGKKENPVSLC